MNNEIYKRIFSSILLIPFSVFFIIKGSFFFIFFLLICFLITSYEWYMMSKKKKFFLIGYIFLSFSFYSVIELRNNFPDLISDYDILQVTKEHKINYLPI